MAALIEMRNLRGEASGLVPEEVHVRLMTANVSNTRLNSHYPFGQFVRINYLYFPAFVDNTLFLLKSV